MSTRSKWGSLWRIYRPSACNSKHPNIGEPMGVQETGLVLRRSDHFVDVWEGILKLHLLRKWSHQTSWNQAILILVGSGSPIITYLPLLGVPLLQQKKTPGGSAFFFGGEASWKAAAQDPWNCCQWETGKYEGSHATLPVLAVKTILVFPFKKDIGPTSTFSGKKRMAFMDADPLNIQKDRDP